MNVRRGSIQAGSRVVERDLGCREAPWIVAFCMAVRPWCDLAATATGKASRAWLAGSYVGRSVCDESVGFESGREVAAGSLLREDEENRGDSPSASASDGCSSQSRGDDIPELLRGARASSGAIFSVSPDGS